MPDRIIREKERLELTGLSRTTWWRLAKRGEVPKAVRLTGSIVGWKLSDIQEWINSRSNTAA